MTSTKSFNFNKKINFNQRINLTFNANSFTNDIIIYNFFIKKLYSKFRIDINKLINIYIKICNKKISKDVNPATIYINMNLILKKFNTFSKDVKINKLIELFEYMIINHHYFSSSEFIKESLKRKIVRMLIFSDNSNFDYYIFLLVNVKKIEIITHHKKNIDEFNSGQNKIDDIDFMLDNLDSTNLNDHFEDDNYDFLII